MERVNKLKREIYLWEYKFLKAKKEA